MSRRTTVRRIEVIAANSVENLLNTASTFKCFSIALDESTDIEDTSHIWVTRFHCFFSQTTTVPHPFVISLIFGYWFSSMIGFQKLRTLPLSPHLCIYMKATVLFSAYTTA